MGLTDVFPTGMDTAASKALVERLERRMVNSGINKQLGKMYARREKPCDQRQRLKIKYVKAWKERTLLRTLAKVLAVRNRRVR
mmetsp:Transcript_4855/g.7207  ORF Transcript_4855/g.7207 Transcript_4855/m.7207 type:complete len:83 (-) Transcript_4855:172-420(-)